MKIWGPVSVVEAVVENIQSGAGDNCAGVSTVLAVAPTYAVGGNAGGTSTVEATGDYLVSVMALVSGTGGDGMTESDVFDGGETLVLTLINDTWLPSS